MLLARLQLSSSPAQEHQGQAQGRELLRRAVISLRLRKPLQGLLVSCRCDCVHCQEGFWCKRHGAKDQWLCRSSPKALKVASGLPSVLASVLAGSGMFLIESDRTA